jgi:lipid II:glycine glycyltransferase (peptidoglycan interpeptide bridge formation enzyme)
MNLLIIDHKKEWDDFLLAHSPQSLFQSWEWGEIEKKSGKDIYRYGIYQNTVLIGIAQTMIVRAKRGTYIHIRQGPVVLSNSAKTWKECISLFFDVAKKERALFIRISPMIEDTSDNRDILKEAGFVWSPIHEVDAERCWVLDIGKPEEEILQGMRKTTRYEIRRGLKMDIEVKSTIKASDVTQFSELYRETSKRHGFVSHGSIVEEFEYFASHNQAVLLLGYFEHTLIASAIILFYGGQAIYHHGASRPSKIPVSYLLQWRAILEAKKRGITLYNFYGIAPEDKPNHPWNGLTLFKKGFGGYEKRYMHAHDYPVSPLYILPKLIESIRTKLRGYE